MPGISSRFSLPNSTFPPGPFRRGELNSQTLSQLAEITPTPENVHQIAFFGGRVNGESVRNAITDIYDIDLGLFEAPSVLNNYLREWPSGEVKDIIPVAEQYKLVIHSDRLWIYLPEIFFVDDEGLVVRCGPFLMKPNGLDNSPEARVIRPDSFGTIFSHSANWTAANHPHISASGHVCLGTEGSAYFAQFKAGDNLGCCMAMESILPFYNPDDPYHHLNEVIPAKTTVPTIETEPVLHWDERGGSFCIRDKCIAEKAAVEIGGMTFNLTQMEHEAIKEMPSAFANYLTYLCQTYASGSAGPQERTLMDRLLPPGNSRLDRLAEAGINSTPAFNEDDEPLEAAVLPPDRRLPLELPSHIKELANATPDHSDPEEADTSEGENPEPQEERGDEEVASSDPVAAV